MDLKELYEVARRLDPAVTLDRIRQAQTEEERNFWAYVHDMNLQRAQKMAIVKNMF